MKRSHHATTSMMPMSSSCSPPRLQLNLPPSPLQAILPSFQLLFLCQSGHFQVE
ncbi:hypothetical protein HanXRQr2_Chr07g0289521 [Helianthus annuus]|uniref:Uncharacterized protein n=1 Tax=Helianthus annuus TaxID=4232 RepID=A0A9K3NF39_HELAN|nr:hypothetical protein HanXRQr2_Chr07g0289521 [Helianthus annuus]